ncbi:endo-1,4-beta-xylanase [Emticicia sp.]|uniref:endo-1,4-beta-xylanase n=1 Tax=Emticicia sp. TaxID=1930953 RepID=UPI0037527FE0
MKLYKHTTLSIIIFATSLFSCKKEVNEPSPTPIPIPEYTFTDVAGPLKSSAKFPIGFAIDYAPYINDAKYKALIAAEGNSVTFGYNMKHGSLVKNDGNVDFTSADALFNAATSAGLEVFGHTLGWHQNQNATYLKSVIGGGAGTNPVNLLVNGGFELGSGNDFTNWSKYNGANSIVQTTIATEKTEGTRALKAIVNTAGDPWSVQLASDEFKTVSGKSFKISFSIKALSPNGLMRVSTQGGTAQYSNNYAITTDWSVISWTFPATADLTRVLFDVGSTANTYLIDNVTVVDAAGGVAPTGAALVNAVDNALKDFITKTVTHYKGKVKAWDVINEAMADGTSGLRLSRNSAAVGTTTDYFFWGDYLGRDWGLKAFQYAAATDPAALLFINDYNLESNEAKLDSTIKYVNYLKAKGAKIDGIGTQMHISIGTSNAGIDNMMKKLAATGLKIRISELDIRVNQSDVSGFVTSATIDKYQAIMYKYVVDSYQKNIPAAQQHGITIWGVSDADSWINTSLKKVDAPLLFDKDYNKKPSYSAVLQSLKGK